MVTRMQSGAAAAAVCCLLVIASATSTGRGGGIEDRDPEMLRVVREEMKRDWENPTYSLEEASITDVQQLWWDELGRRSDSRVASERVLRKEIRTTTPEEWSSYVSSVWSAMTTYPDANSSYSEYDLFVQNHLFVNAPAAHWGAAFLAWHREFLTRYETMLLSHGLIGGIPYWDLTLDSYLDEPYSSMMWSDVFMGHARGIVDTGPFAHFPVMDRCILREDLGFIGADMVERSFQNTSFTTSEMYKDEDIEYFFSLTQYKELCRMAHNYFEDRHDMGHRVVSGHMSDVNCSPSDPLFFIFHGYVDYLWEEFRNHHQETDLEAEYPTELIGGNKHSADADMKPFTPRINIDGLRHVYTQEHYTYAPTPDTCTTATDCGSPYLGCDTTRGRCISVVRAGYPCASAGEQDLCYGVCVDGVCT